MKEQQRCQSCEGRGWILAGNDEHGLRVERCDKCGALDSDEQAAKEAWPILSRAGEALFLCREVLAWLEDSFRDDALPVDLVERLRRLCGSTSRPADKCVPCECRNCNWRGDVSECGEIHRLLDRVDAGDEFPAGECPRCGALAYLARTAGQDGANEAPTS